MKNISRASALALSALFFAAPAAASVVVVGGSAGESCYQAAKARDGSRQALRYCDEALQSGALIGSDLVATFVNRGVVKLVGARYDDAIADFDQAMALDPSEPEAYLNKGSALLRKNASKQQAISLFSGALERKTRRPELAYYARAVAHEETGNIKAAYFDYQRAQEAAPRWELPALELRRFQVRPASGTKL